MMNRIISTAAVAFAALAIGVTAPAAFAAAALPVVYGDDGSVNFHDPDVRPHGQQRWIFGAGGHQWITRMSWSHWGANNAHGAGAIHTCTFSGGTFHCHRHHVTMLLYQVRKHNGHKYYSKLTLRWSGHVQRPTYRRHGSSDVFWG
jgi:hypothetical protein